ncbi:MAG: hypothetical protein JWO83_3433 [Caulobacteraceae bacterium]|nr:hypothetical protein [Caulobacteraceae bacterium]
MSTWRIGDNVAWSSAWSAETGFALRASADFPGMLEVSQVDRQGQGEPLFAAVHVDRQRRGIVDGRCHVCGVRTDMGDRWMCPVASGGFVTLHDGRRGFGCNVPPLHGACAGLAAARCPHLGRLVEAPTPWPDEEGRVIQRTDVPPGMEALAATLPRDREIIYSCYRLFSPDVADRIAALRDAWDVQIRAGRTAT